MSVLFWPQCTHQPRACNITSQQKGLGFESRLSGVCMLSMCLRGLPQGPSVSSHTPKTREVRFIGGSKLTVCEWFYTYMNIICHLFLKTWKKWPISNQAYCKKPCGSRESLCCIHLSNPSMISASHSSICLYTPNPSPPPFSLNCSQYHFFPPHFSFNFIFLCLFWLVPFLISHFAVILPASIFCPEVSSFLDPV